MRNETPRPEGHMNRVRLFVGIVVALVIIGVLAFPIKDRCGAADYACATAPDARGYVHYYYEVKPLGAVLIEFATHSKFPFHYTSGAEKVHY
jgi:hypothetical protein